MIKVEDLTKHYGNKCAVSDVSFEVATGEVFGLLGPNGAGKTTIIKMLTALSRPDKGKIIIKEIDAVKNRGDIKKLISLVPQERNLDRELTVYENMLIYGMLYSMEHLKEKIDESLSLLGLSGEKDTVVENLSGGMQRRLLIARALLSEPEIIFMDEPTIGLDPQIRRAIWDVIKNIKNSGRTVFITTHYMEEAESLCRRVGIISKGRLIVIDTPDNLKNSIGKYVVEIKTDNGRTKRLISKDRQDAERIAMTEDNGAVIRRINLEDVFIEVTGDEMQ